MPLSTARILTALQPSGRLHIGNYFGALQPLRILTEETDPAPICYLMVADLHALTSLRDSVELRQNILDIVKDYLAAGFDPEKYVIFRQSDNPDHAALAWILNCQVTVPFLMQAHSYKDKVAKGLDANAGLFTYPMLMAADIALYDTDIVPVGEDQRQHLEYTREVVSKFNRAYGDTLKEPAERILSDVGVVPGIDGQKMSKSYNNTIPLFGSPEETEKAVMKIVTDSDGSFPEHVYAIHALVRPESELQPLYAENAGQYATLKRQLVADLNEYLAPIRSARAAIDDATVQQVLTDGALRAQTVSNATLERVQHAVGLDLP